MLVRVLAIVMCPSVCLSVTCRYCVKMAKHTVTQTVPRDRPGTLCAFQRAIDEPFTLPLSPPKDGTKRDFAVFASKIRLLSQKSAAKFLRVKTSSSKAVATSFLYLMVHRRIAGDVPIYLKFALKVTHPFRKRQFWQISLNCAAAMRACERSSIITNRKLTMRFPSSHRWPCALPLSPPKGGSKGEFLHFALPVICCR